MEIIGGNPDYIKMKYFIFRACWPQFDQGIYIVQASNKTDAESKLKRSGLNPRHWTYVRYSECEVMI